MNHQQRRDYADAIVAQREADKAANKQAAIAAGTHPTTEQRVNNTIESFLGGVFLAQLGRGIIDMFRGPQR